MVMREGEPTAALRFLASSARSQAQPALCELNARLCKWWGETPRGLRDALIEEASPPPPRPALDKARKFLIEAGLVAWVDEQNVGKGITPRSAVLLEQAHKLQSAAGVKIPARKKSKYAYQWLRRWRERWAIRMSTLAPNEMLPVPELREKAS